MTSRFKLIPALVAVATLTACTPESRNADPDVSVARGETLYFQKCAACHGDDGKGAGPESLGLGAPPPDLTTLSAQNRGIFPQNFVMSVIDGFNRRDHPASAMPEFGNEDLGPEVQVEDGGVSTPIPSDLIALAAYLESIQR
ncbi:MAG: cytochrome c [Pseudomonadota bacterium]